MIKSDQDVIVAQPTVFTLPKRTDVLIAVEEEERKRRNLQVLANKQQNASVPSKVFKFIDRKYSTDYLEYPNSGNATSQPTVEGGSAPASKKV